MPPETLLRTKLSAPPPRRNLVARPQLVERLQAGLWSEAAPARKLTLISAPAGYGKTTLAAGWLQSAGLPVAWLSLDEEDNDPARFLEYLAAALEQVDPQITAAARGMLSAPQPPPVEAILTILLNQMATRTAPLILTLDDYHLIHAPAIHRQLEYLLEHQPPQMHLMLLTRSDPPLPLHRLRARGELNEFRQEDLRFSAAEAAEFLQRVMALDLNSEDVASLVRRTEGWISGLQLAAISLRAYPDQEDFVRAFSGSNRYVLDYLFEEVFKNQPAQVQDFLLATSLLNRLSAALCQAVSGYADSRNILQALEKGNLFIVSLDPAHTWYRYHHLFADLLRHQLQLQQPQRTAELHLRASQWFEANDFLSEAIQHALAGADWPRAARLILQTSAGMLPRGEIATLLNWYSKLPAEILQGEARLALNYGWVLILSGQLDPAEVILAQAEQTCPPESAFLGEVLSAQAYLARTRGDMPRTVALSQRALALLPEDNLVARSNLSVNLGILYWHAGEIAQAETMLVQAQRTAGPCGNHYALLAATVFLGRVMAVRGQLHRAAETCQHIIRSAGQSPLVALAYLDLGSLHYEWNDLASADDYLRQGVDMCRASGNAEQEVPVEFLLAGYLAQARLRRAQGQAQAAGALMKEAQALASNPNVPAQARARCAASFVEACLAQSDLAAAQEWQAQAGPGVDANPFFRSLGLNQARLLLAQGQKAPAAELLEECARQAQARQWGYGLLAVRLLQALAAATPQASQDFLRQALEFAHNEGYLRSFADTPGQADLAKRLQACAAQGIYPEYIGAILALFKDQAAAHEYAAGVTGAGVLAEPLSEREIEVLRLVAAGLSNRAIASQLYLGLGTVKTHVHNLSAKLGAASRTQAVARARELGLL